MIYKILFNRYDYRNMNKKIKKIKNIIIRKFKKRYVKQL